MSGHGDHDEAHEHDDHHDDDDHHAPPPLPEPATPLWLTLLGVGLFLGAGILFVATRSEGKTTAELTPVASAEAPSVEAPAAPSPGAARPSAPNLPAGAAQPAARPQRPGHEGHDHD
jgi:hypothetical protein